MTQPRWLGLFLGLALIVPGIGFGQEPAAPEQLRMMGQCKGCVLEGLELSGARLTGINLNGATLKAAVFEDVILEGTDLATGITCNTQVADETTDSTECN